MSLQKKNVNTETEPRPYSIQSVRWTMQSWKKKKGKGAFSRVTFSAGGSVVKSKQPLELREAWILV